MIADEVEVVFRADTASYIRNVTAAENTFSAKVDAMQADAERLGSSFSRIGQRAQRGFAGISREAPRAATAIRGANVQVGNLAAQFQDIGVQLAGGASPFTIISQQVPQIVAATGSVRGAIGGLGAALTQLISPVGLVSTAFILAASVAASYFSDLLSDGEDAEKTLKEQEALIRRVADRWGDAVPALREYADELERANEAGEGREAAGQLIVRDFTAANKALDEFITSLGSIEMPADFFASKNAKETGDFVIALAGLKKAYSDLREEQARGGDTADEFAEINRLVGEIQQNKLIPTTGDLRDVVTRLADAWKSAASAAQGYITTTEGLGAGSGTPPGPPRLTLPNEAPTPNRLSPDDFYSSGDQRFTDATSFLKSRAVSDRIAERIDGLDNKLSDALAQLFAQFPNVKIVSAVRTFDEQKAIYDSGVRPAAKPGTSRHERGDAVDLRIPPEDIAAFAEAARQVGLENLARIGDPGHYQVAGQRDIGAGGGAEKKSPAQLFEGDIAQVQKRIDLLNAEIEATAGLSKGVEDYGYAVEKAKIKAELLNEAKAKELEITPELMARIDQLAGNYAKLSAAKQQNIEADRAFKKSQEELARSQEEFNNLAKDVLGGFITDLVNGKSAAEALAGALEKVASKLLDIALDQLFSSAGGGGGLGGFISSFFGGFKASGGPVSSGKGYIVGEKGPEFFMPASSGSIIPNMPSTPDFTKRSSQPSSGFIRVDGQFEVVNGNLIPLVSGVSGIVAGQQVKQSNKTMTGRLAQNQARGTTS